MSFRTSRQPGNTQPDDGSSVIGPLIGARRPRYEILHDILDDFVSSLPVGEDIYFFINVTSMLRQFFSEYSVTRLTQGELQRHPRDLAAELLNVAGHYRNFVWKHHGRNASVFMYYSSERCEYKLSINPEYKHSIYAKRIGGATAEYDVVRNYVNFNLRVLKELAARIPHVHLVDTKQMDPDAWPWAVAMEGRVLGSAIVLSSQTNDLQYVLNPGVDPLSGRMWAVLKPSGEHTRLVTAENLFQEVLRSSKTVDELAQKLEPNHFLYILALAGDDDIGVDGLPKFGLAKAAKHIIKCIEKGRLPPDSPTIDSLIADGQLPEGTEEIARKCWAQLVHEDYTPHVPEGDLSRIESQLVNLSGLGELEKANARFFGGRLNIDLLFAGESF